MNDLFQDMVDLFVIIYLDSILIFSTSLDDHHNHICRILQCLCERNLCTKILKCTFHTDTIKYLGFIITPAGVQMDSTKFNAVLNWLVPTSVNEVQLFLGFTNFYCCFIMTYSDLTHPLI